jgi:AcrR family transcriptional regulator
VNNVNIPKRAYHHGNLRAALVQAALHAIAEHGPDGFTLRDVARRAGVSPAAPYRHFHDKDELFAAVAAECSDQLSQMVTAAVAEAPADDPLAQFRQVGIACVEFAVAHPEHFRALSLPGVMARLPAEQQQGLEAWQQNQRRALAAAQEAGAIGKMPLDQLVLAAGALVHGLSHMIVEGQLGEVSPERAKQLAVAVTGVLGIGLLPRAEGDRPLMAGMYPPAAEPGSSAADDAAPSADSAAAPPSPAVPTLPGVAAGLSRPPPAPQPASASAGDSPATSATSRASDHAPRKGMRGVRPKR